MQIPYLNHQILLYLQLNTRSFYFILSGKYNFFYRIVALSVLYRCLNSSLGNYGCNVDVSMGQMGDLDPSALKEVRKIIAAFIGTSEQDCKGRMKMGVFEFDQTTYAPLIHFGLHSDYASLQNAFQTQSDIRTAYPRGSAAIQYILNSLTQNQQSDMVKAGVLLVDDEVYSKYETLIKAYNAYAKGIHVIVMSVSQAGSLLTQQDKVNMANGVAANTFTVNNIASLNTDGKAYLINILGQCKFSTLDCTFANSLFDSVITLFLSL